MKRILMVAGGTGGHIFPALAVAEELVKGGVDIQWLGSPQRMEAQLIPGKYPFHTIAIEAIRGKGWQTRCLAPWRIIKACFQSLRVLRALKPDLILAMGGFVSGPAGLSAKCLGIPLLVHEQNAIAGMTNTWLAKWANGVLQAFPNTFPSQVEALTVGNPIRSELLDLPSPSTRLSGRKGSGRILVLGGSQGAHAINLMMCEALSGWNAQVPLSLRHQTGQQDVAWVRQAYADCGIEAVVSSFIEDMREALEWADVVVCRAGALTVSELAVVGVASILIPFPAAVDDHQRYNAAYLVDVGAAFLLRESPGAARELERILLSLMCDEYRRIEMATLARAQARPEATQRVAAECCRWML